MKKPGEVIVLPMAGFEILREIFQEDMRRCCTKALGDAMWRRIARRIAELEEKEKTKGMAFQRVAFGLTAEGEITGVVMLVMPEQGAEV